MTTALEVRKKLHELDREAYVLVRDDLPPGYVDEVFLAHERRTVRSKFDRGLESLFSCVFLPPFPYGGHE